MPALDRPGTLRRQPLQRGTRPAALDGPRHRLDPDGAPAVLVAQPYGLAAEDVVDLANVAEQRQLDLRIDGTGWYGFGTTFVELWAQR